MSKSRWRSQRCPACGVYGDIQDQVAPEEAGRDGPYTVCICWNPDCRVDIYHGAPQTEES